jgi:hypothetical protein
MYNGYSTLPDVSTAHLLPLVTLQLLPKELLLVL